MTTSIIVGVDQSESAKMAARTAARLAHALRAELWVVTAYGKYEFEPLPEAEDIFISSQDLALTVADQVVAELKASHPDLVATSIAAPGKPGEALVRAAERHQAEMIVIGNKHVQGLVRVFGSIARDVAAHTTCDVYVVNTQSRR